MHELQTSRNGTAAPARTTLGSLELRCPPLPQTLIEAMELIEQPEKLEVGPVTEMVQRDPVVVARLLHIVNSAYYGLRHSISSAERAVVMLGPVAVTGIVVGMNILKLRSVVEGPALECFHQLTRHSLATAFVTRHLLEGPPRERTALARSNPARIGVSYTAGLLHDFGKIILVYNFPEEAVAFYQQQALAQQVLDPDTCHLEQLLFGFDHTEAGEYVARKLNFPDLLTDVIRMHHDTEQAAGKEETSRVLRAVYGANLATKALGYAFTRVLTWDEVALDPVWEQIIALDLPHHDNPPRLLQEIQAQQEHLDLYVQSMTAAPAPERQQHLRLYNGR